ncbi:MAG: hypothetical protein EA412_09145 [Chitinophagaceae bacterium]|nr:MAG: hypothetical protein EA412_09145 [Chitinophagaceae bacterium]
MNAQSEKPKILIITYYWPPAGGIMVQRVLKFCKYLSKLGWEPVVLTTKKGTYPIVDYQLLEEIDPSLKVYKTKSFEPLAIYARLKGGKNETVPVGMRGMEKDSSFLTKLATYIRANFFIPDARKGFVSYAYKSALKIIEDENIRAILTTGPPHSTHLAGLKLKEKIGLPWLADFRDPWVNIYYNQFLPRTKSTQKKDLNLQNKVLKQADVTLAVGRTLMNELTPEAKKVELVYNGFDEDNFPESLFVENPQDKFLLLYPGNLLPGQDLKVVLNAIQSLIEKNESFKKDFCFDFTGNLDNETRHLFKSFPHRENVKVSDYVPYNEIIKKMVQKSSLLLLLAQDIPQKPPPPGKLFDFIAARTTVLGVGPENSDAREVVLDSGIGKMFLSTEQMQIEDFLLANYEKWKENAQQKTFLTMTDKMKNYSRENQTKRLVEILNTLV